MTDYLERCAGEALRRAGATDSEVADFADVMVINCGYECRELTPRAALCYLIEWRNERRLIAGNARLARARRLNAGYLGTPVDAPVYCNGGTRW